MFETPPPSPGIRRLGAAAEFAVGCIGTALLGAVLLVFSVAIVQDQKYLQGCAVLLLLVALALMLFLRKQRPASAWGIAFGGAVVFLLGTICASVRWGG
jgi:hypothetical protein